MLLLTRITIIMRIIILAVSRMIEIAILTSGKVKIIISWAIYTVIM